MAWQLIYTSAERGLIPGSSGFCTVARHATLPDRLVQTVERFSAYDRNSFAGQLPVIRCHRILNLGSQQYHILSCIQDAGPDYSGRTNHIAHHLVATPEELSNATSPARVLKDFPWEKLWSEARYFDDHELVNLATYNRAADGSWQTLTGHGDHAQLLTRPESRRGCYVAYQPGRDDLVLGAFDESLSRLTPNQPQKKWQIAFTTYLQPSDLPTDFIWRGCWVGSPAHRAAPLDRLFDLTRPETLPRFVATPQPPTTDSDRAVATSPKPTPTRVTGERIGPQRVFSHSSGDLLGSIPPEVLAAKKRRATFWLLVFGTASLLVVTGAWIGWRKWHEHRKEASPSSFSSSDESPPTSVVESDKPHIPPQPEPLSALSTTARAPADDLPTNLVVVKPLPNVAQIPIQIVIGNLRAGLNVSGILTGTLPTNCQAVFAQPVFREFPPKHDAEDLDIVTGNPSYFRNGTINRAEIRHGSFKLLNHAASHVSLLFAHAQLIFLDQTATNAPFQLRTNALVLATTISVQPELRQQIAEGLPRDASFRLRTTNLLSDQGSDPKLKLEVMRQQREGVVAQKSNVWSQAVAAQEQFLSKLRDDPAKSIAEQIPKSQPAYSASTNWIARNPYQAKSDLEVAFRNRVKNLVQECKDEITMDEKSKSMVLQNFDKHIDARTIVNIPSWFGLKPMDSRDNLLKFVSAVTNTYSAFLGTLEQQKAASSKAERLRIEWNRALSELSMLKVAPEQLLPVYFEIQVGTNWYPLIEFTL